MLKTILIGNLGGDPVQRQIPSGDTVVSFRVAVSNGRDRAPTWVKVTVWDKLCDVCLKYLRKGSRVAVVGRPKASAWTGQDGRLNAALEMTASEVEFLSSRQDQEDTPPAPVDPETGLEIVEPEDIPF